MDIVAEYLRRYGPCLTSDVSEYLVQSHGLSAVAARKRVSRSPEPVKRLGFVIFPRRARFIYLEQQFGSADYWHNLIEALHATNSIYGHALAALRLRDGIVPEQHFAIACGAPVKQARHLSPDTIVTRLHKAGLVKTLPIAGLGNCIALANDEEHFERKAIIIRARLTTEEILLSAVRDWVRKLGLGSYDRVKMRSGPALPMVGTFAWDLSAPSYLSPMIRSDKSGRVKPGFVVCDVLFGRRLDVADVRPFITKCVTLRGLMNVGPCLQMFVAERYSREAFALLKKHGIVPATPRTLFGEEVAEALSEVTSVLISAAYAALDPVKLDGLFRRLGKIEGAATQLRGTLFEFLVASFWRSEGEDVDLNRIFKEGAQSAEVDVLIHRKRTSVKFIECKGYSPYGTVPDEEVRKWLEVRVPFLFKQALAHPDWRNHHYKFELWCSGQLSPESLAMIEEARGRIKKARYEIELLRGPEIMELFVAGRDEAHSIAFEKHFLKPYEPEEFFGWEEEEVGAGGRAEATLRNQTTILSKFPC